MRLTWWLTIFILGSGAAGTVPAAASQLHGSMASEAVQVEAIAPDSPLLLAQAEDEKKDEKKDKDKKKDDKKESDKDKKDKKEEKSGGGGGLRRWLLLGGGGVLAGGVLAGGAWMFLRRRGDDDYDDELDEDGGDFDGDEVVVGEVANGEDEPTTRTVDVVGSPSSSDGKAASGERSNDSESGAIAGTVARMQDPSGSLPTRVLPPTPADRLLSELRDPSASVRRRAIWNLGERGDSRAIAPLMELLVTADSQQRSIILAVLSEIGTRILRPMERAMAISLQDSDPEVRLNAIRDLTQVYDRFAQVSRMVAYATEDEDETVQKTAKWALGKLNSLRMTSEGASEQTTEGGQSAGYNIANSEVDGALLLEQARRACDEKDYDQASTLVSEALAQDPSHPKGHLLVAEIAAAQDYPIKALIAEQQARDCAWDRGDGATAIAIQENWLAQELDPDRAALCHAQAVQALRANQTDDALGLLDEALVCNPHNPEVYMARARVLRQQGKLGEACAHWQKAQEIYLDLGDVNALRCVQQLLKRFS